MNRVLLGATEGLDGVTLRDLYERYPDLDVDVPAEQEALAAHDVVVFHHPLYWYSVPPLLKQWQDLVLEHGWAYGRGGDALRGKWALHAITAGGGEAAYASEGRNRYTIPELLRPLEQTAALCGMTWLPPFVAHGTHGMTRDDMARHAADYRRVLTALRDGAVDPPRLAGVRRLNADLDAALGGPAAAPPGGPG